MKTIKQCFNSIEDPEVRKRALANMDESIADKCVSGLPVAYGLGFKTSWDKTPEGWDYWLTQQNKAWLNRYKNAA